MSIILYAKRLFYKGTWFGDSSFFYYKAKKYLMEALDLWGKMALSRKLA